MHSCSVIEDSGGGSIPAALGGPPIGLTNLSPNLGLSPPANKGGPFDDGGSCMVAIAALITEGRMPPPAALAKRPPFTEGPHCAFNKRAAQHICNREDQLCTKYEKMKTYVTSLWQKNIPLCVQVLLVPKCCCEEDLFCSVSSTILEQIGSAVLLEEWNISCMYRRTHDLTNLNITQLMNAIRSQLYFSQITAWLASPDEKIRKTFPKNRIVYCLTVPGETYGCKKFATNAQQHNFPMADIGNGIILKVRLSNLPRSEEIPLLQCSKCTSQISSQTVPNSIRTNTADNSNLKVSMLDDRMQTYCTLKGKHHCEDIEDYENPSQHIRLKQLALKNSETNNFLNKPSTSKSIANNNYNPGTSNCHQNPVKCHQNSVNCQTNIKCQNSNSQNTVKTQSFSCQSCVSCQNTIKCQNVGCQNSVNSQKIDITIPKNDKKDLRSIRNKGDILLDAIMRPKNNNNNFKVDQFATISDAVNNDKNYGTFSKHSGVFLERNKRKCVQKQFLSKKVNYMCDINCDLNNSEKNLISDKKFFIDNNFCDNKKTFSNDVNIKDISNIFSIEYIEKRQKVKVKQKLTFQDESNNQNASSDISNNTDQLISPNSEDIYSNLLSKNNEEKLIPSASDQAKFRKNLDNAASMVFHSRTGLPLTSSPAPVRRGKCFDFDSSINSVSAIRSALFSLAPACSTDEDSESDCSIVSPCSPDALSNLKPSKITPYNLHRRGQTGLLGNFEESVLNGRLEPVSTVHGFTAELGASGSFCPRHAMLPVTVFFYTLGDNDKVSTPYLGHINLGKKGYNVPKSGTIQVTLFNPLGTVVKMFVIMYDLSDMPPNSQTFIRQRTLYMPANLSEKDVQWSQKWLRYLVHLRFMSSKSGRIYLHSDIRMIICRKSDLDTATAHELDMSYELRSFTHSPTNPKFSPRK